MKTQIRFSNRRTAWVVAGASLALLGAAATAFSTQGGGDRAFAAAIPTRSAPEVRGTMVAELTPPPAVPAAIDRDYATRVVVNLETVEVAMPIADGTTYKFWTVGGTVPGS